MGRSYAPEFRHRVVQRVRSGHSVKKVATEVGAADATVFRWVAQDKVDRGERSGTSSRNRTELARAHRRIRELESVRPVGFRVRRDCISTRGHFKAWPRTSGPLSPYT